MLVFFIPTGNFDINFKKGYIEMIVIKNDNNSDYKYIIHSKLRENNRNRCYWIKENILGDVKIPTRKEYNFLAFDNDKLVGGAIGFVDYNWYYLDLLYVDDDYRGIDVGSNLIKNIETFAKAEKLTGIRVETWNFQARGFYEKQGFTVFAELNNCPPGTIEYHLKKEIL